MLKLISRACIWLAMLGPICSRAQTAFIDNFNDGVSGWNGDSYVLKAEGGAAKVIGNKTFQWDLFSKNFGPIDISSSPYVSIKIRTKKALNIAVGLRTDQNGSPIFSFPRKPAPANLAIFWPDNDIVPSDDFQEYSFNFSGAIVDYSNLPLDLKKITWISILINPLAPFDNTAAGEEFYIDDVKIGTAAKLTPSISNVANQHFVVKETGTVAKVVSLRNITDGGDLTNKITITATSSNMTLVPNSNLIVDYTSPSRQGTLSIRPNDNMVGESLITLKAAAANMADKLTSFKVIVKPNAAPVMETIAPIQLQKGVATKIPLRVFDGDPDAFQELTISSTASNTDITPNPIVTFDKATGVGNLIVTPTNAAANGSTYTISVVLADDGGAAHGGINTKTYTFDATVYGEINKPPYFDSISDFATVNRIGSHELVLKRVSNGDKGDNDILFSAVSSDTAIIDDISFSRISNGSVVMIYSTLGYGTAEITVTLRDTQGNTSNNGNQYYAQTFKISTRQVTFFEGFDGSTIPLGVSADKFLNLSIDKGALKVSADVPEKEFPGTIFELPTIVGRTIDISQNSFVKLRVKSSSANLNGDDSKYGDDLTLFDIHLLDQDSNLVHLRSDYPADNQWHELTFDFRRKFFNYGKGRFDSTKIKQIAVYFDARWWVPSKGEYWIDFIQMGEGVLLEPSGPKISNQNVLKGEIPKPIVLTGIDDGQGGDNVRFSISNSNPALVSNLSISDVVNGTATLTYAIAPTSVKLDSAKIKVVTFYPDKPDYKKDSVSFYIFAVDTASTSASTVTINKTQTFQTIKGIGTRLSKRPLSEILEVANDLNLKLYRVLGEFDTIEEVNDNGNPN
ncbi:MAG TPA: hypothetical protein VF691_22895, partial [Cytophagaceae bacterium]